MRCRFAGQIASFLVFRRLVAPAGIFCALFLLCSSIRAQPPGISCSGVLRLPHCVTYTGGNSVSNGMTIPYNSVSHMDYGGGVSGVSSCGGAITARVKFVYPAMQNPPPPPPAQMTITIIAHASAGGEATAGGSVAAAADNGLGDAALSGPPVRGGFGGSPCRPNIPCEGKVSSGMLSFIVRNGASQTQTANNGTVIVTGNTSDFTVTCTPTASLAGSLVTNGGTWVDLKILTHRVQLDIAGPGAIPNNPYSGTNAPAITFTASTDGLYLESMQCILKSAREDTVSSYPDTVNFPSEAQGGANYPKVMSRTRTLTKWDTTNFPDGTNLLLVLRATFVFSGETLTVEKYVGVRIYNKYSIRVVDQFENGQIYPKQGGGTVRKFGMVIGPSVKAWFQVMNHGEAGYSITFMPKDMRGKKNLASQLIELGDIHSATAFQTSAHGFTNAFQPDKNDNGVFDALQSVTATSVRTAMLERVNVPPQAWIVFLSTCSGSEFANPPLAHGFFIEATSTNQAYCGFDREGYIKGMQQAALIFWDAMAKGTTTGGIKLNAQKAYAATWVAD